MVESIEFL